MTVRCNNTEYIFSAVVEVKIVWREKTENVKNHR